MRDLRPPPRGFKGLRTWLHELYLFVISLRPVRTPGVLMRRSQRGTSMVPLFDDDGGAAGDSLQFKGQFNPAVSYDQGDIVICKTAAEEDDGYEAGTYIANQAVSPGDMLPGLVQQAGALTAHLSGDAVDAVTIDDAGAGYAIAPAISITGDGSGATAHAVIVDSRIDSIVVDTGGSGYTHATATIVDSPTMIQHWDDFAIRPKEKTSWRPYNTLRNRQILVVNSGRDSMELPVIYGQVDKDDPEKGAFILDLKELATIAPTAGTGVLVIKFREWQVCESDVSGYAIFLSGAFYTRP